MALYGGALPARLRMWARPHDVAIAICPPDAGRGPGGRHRRGGGVHDALAVAAEHGLLTVALTGPGAFTGHADHVITVRGDDPALAEELHLTVQHLLWELVHLFLSSATPPDGAALTDGQGNPGGPA
jgi:D-sedoheptulose 7-phosphate isomerase